jgi:hypothetical protein
MAIEYYNLQTGSAAGFWIRFVLCILTTWRISHLLVSEDGPWEMFARLRQQLGSSPVGRLMDCFGCVSIWVAAPISLFLSRRPADLFLCWLALSGAAFLLERSHPEPLVVESISEPAREEKTHGMLRQGKSEFELFTWRKRVRDTFDAEGERSEG